MVKFVLSKNYKETLARIENHIFTTTQSLTSVEDFFYSHDEALQFITDYPETPPIHAITYMRTWNFKDGRYRLFYRTAINQSETIIYLTHLIDNKEINLNIYPGNKIHTYDEE